MQIYRMQCSGELPRHLQWHTQLMVQVREWFDEQLGTDLFCGLASLRPGRDLRQIHSCVSRSLRG